MICIDNFTLANFFFEIIWLYILLKFLSFIYVTFKLSILFNYIEHF